MEHCTKCYYAPCVCEMRQEMSSLEKRIEELDRRLVTVRKLKDKAIKDLESVLNDRGVADMAFTPKSVSLLIAPNDYRWQGALLCLMDDGSVYNRGTEGEWELMIDKVKARAE